MGSRRPIDARRFECSLESPLRLRLVAELRTADAISMSLEELVLRSGRHRQDVLACLRPMVDWRVVRCDAAEAQWRLDEDMPAVLRRTLERVIEERREQLDRERRVRNQLLSGMIGVDPKMQLVFEMVRQVARIDVPVQITGDTGTGKELVAQAVHDLSPRRKGFFGAVNCATLTEDLFASEMFGHVRGAFTGAVRDHAGLIERCHEGTLFLDEIADLSLANQVKLLRVLQENTFVRVGDERVRNSQFRLISATNRDLRELVARGDFREDLYYRLNVFPVRLPSLRERLTDLPYLVDEILRSQARRLGSEDSFLVLTPATVERLKRHHWPGNVRELENVIMRAAIMARGAPIEPRHLPELSDGQSPSSSPEREVVDVFRSLSDVEHEHIERVLGATGGNMRQAAHVLGISRTTLYKKVKDYDIDVAALTAAAA